MWNSVRRARCSPGLMLGALLVVVGFEAGCTHCALRAAERSWVEVRTERVKPRVLGRSARSIRELTTDELVRMDRFVRGRYSRVVVLVAPVSTHEPQRSGVASRWENAEFFQSRGTEVCAPMSADLRSIVTIIETHLCDGIGCPDVQWL